jgi:hypothetical protein
LKFIVYSTAPFSGTQHSILRAGDAPEDQIAIQAGTGETAIPSPGGWTYPATLPSGAYFYDSVALTVGFIGFPEPGPTLQDNLDYYLPRIRQALRDSEWALLSDAPLTAPQVAEMVTYRAYLRDLPGEITAGAEEWNLTPPYTEF